MLRYPGRLLLLLVTVLVLVVGVVSLVAVNETASVWLTRQALALAPGELQVAAVHGRLASGLTLEALDYRLAGNRVQTDRLVLRWEPSELLRGTVRITGLEFDNLRIETAPAAPGAEPAGIPERIPLPLILAIDDLRIAPLQVVRQDGATRIDSIELSARAAPLQGLVIRRLAVRMQDSRLALKGRAELNRPYAFTAEADWSTVLPDGLQAAGRASLDGDLHVVELEHTLSQPVKLTTQGNVRFDAEEPRFSLYGGWQNLQWPLSGTADYHGTHGKYRLEGTSSDYRFSLEGPLAGLQIPDAQVRAAGQGDPERLQVDSLVLDTLGGTASASGGIAWTPEFSLALSIRATGLEPGRQWPVGEGSADLGVDLDIADGGTRIMLRNLQLQGRLHGRDLTAHGDLGFDNGVPTTSGLVLEAGANRARLAGRLDSNGLHLNIDAPRPEGLVPGLDGRITADGVLTGSLQAPSGRLDLSAEDLRYADKRAARVEAGAIIEAGAPSTGRIRLKVRDGQFGNLPLEQLVMSAEGSTTRHRVRVQLDSPRANALIEAAGGWRDALWSGQVDTATLSPARGDPWRLREPLELQAGAGRAAPFSACWTAGGEREACLQGEWQDDIARLQANARSREGHAQGSLVIRELSAPRPVLQGALNARIPDIGFLAGLGPGIQVTGGTVAAKAALAGYLDSPTVTGNLRLSKGAVEIPELGLKIGDIELQARGDGERLSLSGSARSGKGDVRLDGELALDPQRQWPFTASLQGGNFAISRLPDLQIDADPDLTLAGTAQGAQVTGKVVIPHARITLKKLPPDVVKVSPDQVIVGPDAPEETAVAPGYPLSLNVVVALGDDVHFEGLGLTTDLAGSLNVRSLQNDRLIGNGVLELHEGRYEGYGQKLDIERGRLLFAGPLDNPALDIRATRKTGPVVAGIELYGNADSPQTRLFSEPAMSDADALSYLVTGKPLGAESTASEGQALAAAAASLGANSPVAQEISQTLGVEIGVQSGTDQSDTSVVVSKQLSSRLSVDYVYGLFNETAAIQFIYELTDHLSLTGQSGTVQSIDLHYNIDVP